jgi:hypothetical protein
MAHGYGCIRLDSANWTMESVPKLMRGNRAIASNGDAYPYFWGQAQWTKITLD